MPVDWRALNRLALRSECRVAGAVLVALALLLTPVPGVLLDLLLALNLAVALGLLLVTAWQRGASRPASLPGSLVLSSLGRIVLAVGVARAVFAGSGAGSLVLSLGLQLTAGGQNLLGGAVMVVILAVVAFMTIGLGVMRLAEVGARFALDALPGRQMALDSSLAGGRLDAADGLAQALELEGTNAFFGAMDGAARFLRAEVTVGVVICSLLPLAGIGVTSGGFATALASAAGLAALLLIPSIMAGAAAAVALTSFPHGDEHSQLPKELLLGPAALVLVALALIPGTVKLPLLVLGGAATAGAWFLRRSERAQPEVAPEETAQLQLRLGLGLVPLTATTDLTAFLLKVRTRLADDIGFPVPPISITDDASLPANDFTVCLDGLPVAQATLRLGRRLALVAGEGALPAAGLEVTLPDGAAATWLRETEWEALPRGQYHLLEPLEVLALYLQETVWNHASQLFDLQRAKEWLAAVEMTHPASVAALASAGIDLSEVQQVGRGLLAEGLPLRERVSLVEALARARNPERAAEDHLAQVTDGSGTFWPLLEAARPALARTITEQVAPEGIVEAIELGAETETALLEQVAQTGMALSPEQARLWAQQLGWLSARFSRPRRPAVILCHPRLRPLLARQIADCGAALRAVTAAELLPLTQLRCKHIVKSLRQQPMMNPEG